MVNVDSIPSLCKASFNLITDTLQRKVSFTNQSIAADLYYWQFGDGKTSTETTPHDYIYEKNGNYPICLSVYSLPQNCFSDTCTIISLFNNDTGQLVKSDFTFVNDNLNNRKLYFTNLSNNASAYYWTFGDGTISTGESQTHLFAQDGTYEVCLSTENTSNNSKSKTCKTVVVGSPNCILSANFSVIIDSMAKARFVNISSGNYQQVYWNFGDGSSSTINNPTYIYQIPGVYYVSLAITDTINNCNHEITKRIEVGNITCQAAFDYFVDSPTRAIKLKSFSIGSISDYIWQLDESATQSGEMCNFTVPSNGNYRVTLSIYSDSTNCSDQISQIIQVDSVSCRASFTYLVDSLAQKANFYGGHNTYNTRYYWLFGDGSINTNPNPVYYFKKPSLYQVSLTIYNPTTQCFDFIEKLVLIGQQGKNFEADFIYFPDNTNPLKMKFRNRSQVNISNFVWNFGDNTLATTPNVVHTYNREGTYNVCLNIANSYGLSNISCKNIKVGASANNLPKADFIYYVNPEILTANFQNTSSVNYTLTNWNFGDGTISSESNPTHTFDQTGLYLIYLRVLNETSYSYHFKLINVGLPDTFSVRFTYILNPYNKKAGGYPIDFIGAGLGDHARLKWDFGDGTLDTTTIGPTHIYQDAGTYEVCLTIGDPITGQEAIYCQNISAQELCQTDTIKPVALCKSINVFVDASSITEISPLDIDNGSYDACGITNRTLSMSQFSIANLGNNNVTLTVTDSKGNVASCNAMVNVQKSTNIEYSTPISLYVYPNPFTHNIYIQSYLEQPDFIEIGITEIYKVNL